MKNQHRPRRFSIVCAFIERGAVIERTLSVEASCITSASLRAREIGRSEFGSVPKILAIRPLT